jgi:hypothetical protein
MEVVDGNTHGWTPKRAGAARGSGWKSNIRTSSSNLTLSTKQRDLLKNLVAKDGELALSPPRPEGWSELERGRYITVASPTRGDLSVLIFQITNKGRQELAVDER